MWIRRVYRHGGSLCIAIPSEVCKARKLQVGRHLAFVLDKEGRMVLEEVSVDRGKAGGTGGGRG